MKDKAQNIACVILAAGKGTRMRSTMPKVMHKVVGKPMLMHVVDTALSCGAQKVVAVTAPEMEHVRTGVKNHYGQAVDNAVQQQQLGTGDAVKAAEEALKGFSGNVIVLYGDTPLIQRETILAMDAALNASPKLAVAVLGMEVEGPNAYGRLVVNKDGGLERIVEVKDATEEEKRIRLCNSGVMAVKSSVLFALLARLDNKNANGEFYLTDLVKHARADGHDCAVVKADGGELMGVNSRVELAVAEAFVQNALRRKAMDNGATLIDPETVYFAHDTKIGKDVIIHPNVVFGVGVEIEDNVEIRSFSHIEGAHVRAHATIGPFARLRPGTDVGESAHVGNFVELKKATLEKGAKANHLSYIGDAHVGAKANIGAGTITCNYDGFKKYKTEIGAGAFIGSNSALVAPVKIGDGAIVAAGSVVTSDVPGDALSVARSRQEDKPGWAKNFREKQ
ncbi:MAG TPA: bifunctional UDP-N-acetylglucosamine diphosphorylase/glucosamine-1-phosphate N-acetyltransferase GlmU [Rickettsiales bacterium]|nr:bifunctional UDP-N-acetylglucosamine diphosphorylase/glucosamine-1-phosphate N-acetyltransferase GlmU [Rickettsiales bacterium]